MTGPFTVQALFGEKVTGFDAADIAVTNGTVSNFNTFPSSVFTFAGGESHSLAIKVRWFADGLGSQYQRPMQRAGGE